MGKTIGVPVKALTFFALLFVLCAQGQVTQKNLQGKWKLVSVTDGSAVIDVEKGTFVLDAGYKNTLSANEIKEEEYNYGILVKQYKTCTLEFKEDRVTQVFIEDNFTGNYTLGQFDNAVTELIIEMDNGSAMVSEISVSDKKLYINDYEEGLELTYKKN